MSNGMKITIIILILLLFMKQPQLLNQLINTITNLFNQLGSSGGH
jgi:hypothetical protein